jgi:para-nitrobenzyl esterase
MVSDSTPEVGINNCLFLKTADAIKPWMPALYQYEFSDPNAPVLGVGIAKGMDPKIDLGAVHSSQLNYLFPNLSNTKAIDAPDLAPASQTLSNQMVALWSSFVHTGVPAAAGLVGMPAWPTYAGGKTVMQLRPGAVELIDAAERHQCQFWTDL